MNTARVVVTGAASGIGAATARMLRASGATVIGVDRAEPPSADEPFVQADLSTVDGVAAAIDAVREISGGAITGLANIAGVPGTAPWELVQRVNVIGLRDLTTGLAPLIEPGGGVVNLASAVAVDWRAHLADVARFCDSAMAEDALGLVDEIPAIREHSYLFSKWCVRYLTEMQAAALIDRRVRCNSVSPGPVETPILEDFKADHGRDKVDGTRRLVGRFGRTDDIAQVIVLLLGEACSWVNGTDIRVDGGLTAIRGTESARAGLR